MKHCDKIFRSVNGLKLHLAKKYATLVKKAPGKNKVVDSKCNTCRAKFVKKNNYQNKLYQN